MFSKKDFKCIDGFYFVGDVIDVDGSPWVDEETLELIILELNNGTDHVIKLDLPQGIAFAPFVNDVFDPVNFISLN